MELPTVFAYLPFWPLLLLPLISATSTASTPNPPKINEKWTSPYTFQGIATFAHLPHLQCLPDPSTTYDIAILGVPFDTAVTYRTGARFGPRAIRDASQRQREGRAFNHRAGINPYQSWAKIVDCGDIPVTPFDNKLAVEMMVEAYREILGRGSEWGLRNTDSSSTKSTKSKKAEEELSIKELIEQEKKIPKIVSLGGDHSIAYAAIKALHEIYGPIAVVHFDAHLDTWSPDAYPSHWTSEQSAFTHGTFFHLAVKEGLIQTNASVHAGLRTRLSGVDYSDYSSEGEWFRIESDIIDDSIPPYGRTMGPDGIASLILDLVPADVPVYLSIDIDVLDPAFAPGTGTPEPGGWSMREMIRILRGIEGLNVVGADVVEVAPAYDNRGETTALAGAQVVYEIVSSLVKRGVEGSRKGMEGGRERRGEYIVEGKQVVGGRKGVGSSSTKKADGKTVKPDEKSKNAKEEKPASKDKGKKGKDEL